MLDIHFFSLLLLNSSMSLGFASSRTRVRVLIDGRQEGREREG